jgi:sodium/hydrogen antiporter
MSVLGWMSLGGGLLLLIALSSASLRRLPVSTSAMYLGVGLAIGPLGWGWLRVDLCEATPWFERLTEEAVIVPVFVGGLKLRLLVRDPAWVTAFRLARPVMLATIVGVALVARVGLGLDTAVALLLGAVRAPTDPVLASAVSVNNAADYDRMRCGCTAAPAIQPPPPISWP